MDTLSRAQRSERMSRIRSKDTKPEIAVRRLVHSLGYRYRLHVGSLPGEPDIVFPCRGKVIFVHGCFWHRHPGCRNNRLPKSRLAYWGPKLDANRNRDIKNQRRLRQKGWAFLVVWECEIGNNPRLTTKIDRFLRFERKVGPRRKSF